MYKMAEQTAAVNSVKEALMVNANVVSISAPAASLSSSSSGISSSSPTSSFGSSGNGGIASEIPVNLKQQPVMQNESMKQTDTDEDDSANNVNIGSAVTSASNGVNSNSSGEPGSSDGDHRGSAEDIITHLNMLSMQDGLGFNGFGLLGTGGGGNAWAPNMVTNMMPTIGNGLSKTMPMQDTQSPGVTNYIEALKVQQQLQIQQLKSNDMLANFFATSSPASNASNVFGSPGQPLQHHQQQQLRRPIIGAGGGHGMENFYPAAYGNYFMNRPPTGIQFPPPLEFGHHGRGKAFSPNASFAIANDINKASQQQRSTTMFNHQMHPPASSSFFSALPQLNAGSIPQTSVPPPTFAARNSLLLNGAAGPNFGHCDSASLYHQQKGIECLPPSVVQQQQNLRRGCQLMNPFNIGGGSSPFRNASFCGMNGPQRYSRKVFVGGLPPDIDEALGKRPSSTLKYSETSSITNMPSSLNPSNMFMIPSNLAMVPAPIARPLPFPRQGNGQQHGNEIYSRKVFIGGLPMDISEDEICNTFVRFGPLIVDWPHKAESKSYFPPKGYAFLIFHNENSVQLLIEACIQQEGRYYICVSSPTMREKAVQIRPWRLADADYVQDPALALDPRKTVFVGGVPRPLKAPELATMLDRLFGGVCYAGIDTDPELKYPKGAGRVSFSNQQSYTAAISARFVQLQHGDIDKRVEIKPYVLDDQMCDECGGQKCGGKYAPFFCANVGCLQYYCEFCWQKIHSSSGREFHKPLVKEGSDRPRAVPFKWGV